MRIEYSQHTKTQTPSLSLSSVRPSVRPSVLSRIRGTKYECINTFQNALVRVRTPFVKHTFWGMGHTLYAPHN